MFAPPPPRGPHPRRLVRRPPSYYEFLATKYGQMQRPRVVPNRHMDSTDTTTSSSCSSSPRSVDESCMPEIIYSQQPQPTQRRYLRNVCLVFTISCLPLFYVFEFLRRHASKKPLLSILTISTSFYLWKNYAKHEHVFWVLLCHCRRPWSILLIFRRWTEFFLIGLRSFIRKMYFCLVQGIGDNNCGIYVKKVVENSAAYRDGRLEKGDQLISVNDQSLIGISQEE